MSVQIAIIQFCWDANQPSSSAIAIQKNEDTRLPNPEWVSNRSFTHDDSVAAYAVNPTRGHKVYIKAGFTTNTPALFGKEVEIRAVQPPIGYPYNPFLSPYLNMLQVVLTTPVNVLGEVKANTIRFDEQGQTGMASFELINHRLLEQGVGINAVTWYWQYRSSAGRPWQTIGRTQHKIYSVLERPNGPWSADENATDLPWTDVLDYACAWAKNARSLSEAASLVTNSVYNLGASILEYNCSTFVPAYVVPVNVLGDSYFNCTAFLLHLKTGLVSRFVICTDCAAIVSTFANILGCNLWQSKMYTQGVSYFRVNPILTIGNVFWTIPCGTSGFAYHEVAWNDDCTEDDEIFDACLALDRDHNPSFYPHLPYLPANMKFGKVGEGLYRDRLAAPTDVLLCNPQPGDRVRRPLSPYRLTSSRARSVTRGFQQDRSKILKDSTRFAEWQDQNRLKENLFIFQHKTPEAILPGWKLQYSHTAPWVPGMARMSQQIWRPASAWRKEGIQINKYECTSLEEAHELVIRLLSDTHIQLEYEEVADIGDVAYAAPTFRAVIFARANLVITLANVDRNQLNLKKLALDFDQSLVRKDSTTGTRTRASEPMTIPIELKSSQGPEPATKIPILFKATKKAKVRSRSLDTVEESGQDLEDLRFFSKDGVFVIENKELVFIPKDPGKNSIQVFGNLAGRTFELRL